MSEDDVQRHNLVFAGQLLPGTDPARARRALAGFFGLGDPAAVEMFFSGRPVPLRRNLSRDDAQRLYRQLRQLGLICEIPRGDTRTVAADPASAAGSRSPGAAARPRERGGSGAAAPAAIDAGPAPADEDWPASAVPRGPAPNLFALRPAIVPPPDGTLRERLQLRALVAGTAVLALVVVVAAVSLRFPAAPLGPQPRGPLAAASGPAGELIMLQPQALLVHRRSGLARARIDAGALGLARFAPPLLVLRDATVLVGARSEGDDHRLLRCELDGPSCEAYGDGVALDAAPALAESYLGDALFLLTPDGRLQRRDATGVTTAASTLPARAAPRLAYHDGLLLAPAADAPLLGVFRPDAARFGTQIDALLLTASAGDGSARRIADMAIGDNARWAILEHDGGSALYRFDRQWGSPQRIGVSVGPDAYLVPWRDRVLVADPGSGGALRIAPDGRREADFLSAMLASEAADWQRVTSERALLRRMGVILPLAAASLALLYALLQGSAIRSLRAATHGRTAILDPMPANIHWLPADGRRERRAARLGGVLAVLALVPAVLLLATGAWLAALCLLPVIAAALYARGALARGLGGHLGFRGSDAVVIDHDGRYFYGPRTMLRRGAGFVFAPGVALPVAPPLLGNIVHFHERAAAPLDDTAHALGLLWQLRHPWLLALLATAAGVLLAVTGAVLAG